MINDQQVKKLRSDLNGGMRLAAAALRSGMSEKTARKYRNMNQLPSEAQQPHHWRTRIDPFESVWDEIQQQLQQSPGLQAKTIFESLQRQYPGRYLFLVYTAWYGLLVHDRCAFGQPPCWLTHPAKSRFRRRLPELLPCRCTPGILREQAARQIIRVKRIIRRESKAISSICVWLILHCSTELDLWI